MPSEHSRCVIIGGADIGSYSHIRSYLKDSDYVIYCDSGLKHMDGLGAAPSLIVGDFDSHDDPHMDTETITLPVAKDDTDTVYAIKEGIRRGFSEFLMLGVIGARLDHTLVNVYALSLISRNGGHGMIADDYSEIELLTGTEEKPATARISCRYPFFSLVAVEGTAEGVTIKDAKFCLEDAEIHPYYQYATSNEVLPGKAAEVTVKRGKLLLIRILDR